MKISEIKNNIPETWSQIYLVFETLSYFIPIMDGV